MGRRTHNAWTPGSGTAIEPLEARVVMAGDAIAELIEIRNPAASFTAGQAIQVEYRFANTGDTALPVGVQYRLFLTQNQVAGDADDIVLSNLTNLTVPPRGGFVQSTFTGQIPQSFTNGQYFAGLRADVDNLVVEANEANNVLFGGVTVNLVGGTPPLDLSIEGLVIQNGTFRSPSVPNFNSTVNLTGGPSTFTVETEYFLSRDNMWDANDFIVRQSDLATGVSSTLTDSGTLPVFVDIEGIRIPTGRYHVGIVVNRQAEFFETNTSNNTWVTPTAVVGVVNQTTGPSVGVFGGGQTDQLIQHDARGRRSLGTDFGPVLRDDATKTSTFRVENLGGVTLTITAIEIRGIDPEAFTIIGNPNLVVDPGEFFTFQVRFDPTDYGPFRANFAIFSNDPTLPRFTGRLSGLGIPSDDLPNLTVTGSINDIRAGDRKARPGTGARFGAASVLQPTVTVFTITNRGGSSLVLTSVTIVFDDAAAFTVLAQPSNSTVAPGQAVTFSVRFAPALGGQARAFVQIVSNDPDNPIFPFRVTGTNLNF